MLFLVLTTNMKKENRSYVSSTLLETIIGDKTKHIVRISLNLNIVRKNLEGRRFEGALCEN